MLLDLLGSVVLFLVMAFGLAWPLVSRLALPPVERLVAAVALSLLGIFLLAWADYVFALPLGLLWLLPVLTLAGLAAGYRALAALAQDREVRDLCGAQLLVTFCCLGWLAFVDSYSGGGWAADWFEHWERARFFLVREPVETKFLGYYLLPARPPLANVVTSVFLQLTRMDFAHYQLFTTLLASLVFLPAGVLARRWGGRRAVAVLAVLFMVNPLFVQNATFAWTKLPAAFFVLGSLWFFLRTRDADAPPGASLICSALLAAGILTHYSAAPYAVVLFAWWFVAGRRHWRTREWQGQTLLTSLVGVLILAAWFAWSASVFGVEQTLFSNSTFTSEDARQGDQFTKIGLNIFDTFVPHFLRTLDTSLIEQRNVWGGWRDWFFQAYQVNLPLAFGSLAWLVLLWELLRARREASRSAWTFWKAFVGTTVLLGIAVTGARDHWGLAHICLQPIVLLGLALLASCWHDRSRGWQRILIAGATFDFAVGIALQFGMQNTGVLQWQAGGLSPEAAIVTLSQTAIMNYAAKFQNGLAFFSEAFPLPLLLRVLFIASLLAFAFWRARAVPFSRS